MVILTRNPPAHLKGEAASAWRQLSPILNSVKVLTPMDIVAFEMLCVTVGNYRKAAAKVADENIIVLGKNGGAMQNPWFAPMNRCLDQLRGLLAEFGMTPAERSRLKVKGGDWRNKPVGRFLSLAAKGPVVGPLQPKRDYCRIAQGYVKDVLSGKISCLQVDQGGLPTSNRRPGPGQEKRQEIPLLF